MNPRQPAETCTVPISEEGESRSEDEKRSANDMNLAFEPFSLRE